MDEPYRTLLGHFRLLGPSGFDTIIDRWLPLAWALNMVNRSMGRDDLYPVMLPIVVLAKMRFIHTIIDEMAIQHVGEAGYINVTMTGHRRRRRSE
jgi:hypothetical protein